MDGSVRLDYSFQWQVWYEYRDFLIQGLELTLSIWVLVMLFGSLIGLVLAFARQSRLRLLGLVANAYVEAFRNVPLLLVIIAVYFGVGTYGIHGLDQFKALLLAMSLYAAAYLSEIFRAGMKSVDKSYVEAGLAIGLSRMQIERHVVLPLMVAQMIPAFTNFSISIFKDTSLGSALSVKELTFAAIQINLQTYRVFEAWAAVGAIYLGVAYLIGFALRAAERHVRRWA